MTGRVTICIKIIIIIVFVWLRNCFKNQFEWGTIRVNCGLPKDMIEEAKKLKKGEVTFRRKQDVLLVTHHDKRLVNMISTLHTAAVVDVSSRCTGVTKKKPKCVADYNTHMHGVDMADQYLAYYPFIRKTVKWPKKVFFYLLQCALFNSYVVFTKSDPNFHKSFLDYLVDVSENLIHTSVDLRASRCSSTSRRLLHTMSYTETLLKVCSKFQIFVSYSFLVIDFFIRRRTSCLTFSKSLAI
jgi:hypothetical protein